MAVDVAQWERSNIKCYAAAFRYIYIYIYIDFWHLLTTSIKILLLEKLE